MFLIYRRTANVNDGEFLGENRFRERYNIAKFTKFRILCVAPALGHIDRIHPLVPGVAITATGET